MRKILLVLTTIALLISCKSTGENTGGKTDKIPGIVTVTKYGKPIDSSTVLQKISDSLSTFTNGRIAQNIYNSILDTPTVKSLYVIDTITYNDDGLATEITGKVVTTKTYREYVALGGLGSPVYEAVPPNEFGLIFGRKGNVAIREGLVVKVDTLSKNPIIDVSIGSETYDKVANASVLYQAFEAARTPYLENTLIELEGMLLNSASKDVIIEDLKKFKLENPKLQDAEVMTSFLLANKSYLDLLKKSNEEAKDRIKKGAELVNAIASGCALQTIALVEHFGNMALEITRIALDPLAIPANTARYIARNVPKGKGMTMNDLNEIQRYGKYQMDVYKKNYDKNLNLWKKTMELKNKI
ncbi:MAG: hypothetical protein A2015_07185 [Spirochaetes bacterium GWF1_31_7]|nr:MAG: hypothetical protein A2Y30_06635 [Spirochaetes bacterium GWE1_32_154]OHD52240.1 MAG: hypothetical protein A2Y29_07115 [Spirochaetes bacterium GWE2_31_10]OHD53040.1 MAG: hypothetical protein A2015_07185 [Spirochaetes bacterium GWF1_31_7]HBD96172.1 hypothetical protein [Spirochaetia bacterium]HBI36490.1 hypothetical protein [Spirochaetia bacterium]